MGSATWHGPSSARGSSAAQEAAGLFPPAALGEAAAAVVGMGVGRILHRDLPGCQRRVRSGGGGHSWGYPGGGWGWGGGLGWGEVDLLPNLFQQPLLPTMPLGHADQLSRELLNPSIEVSELGGCIASEAIHGLSTFLRHLREAMEEADHRRGDGHGQFVMQVVGVHAHPLHHIVFCISGVGLNRALHLLEHILDRLQGLL